MSFTELSPSDCFDQLKTDEASLLVDCRTRAEWMLVGVPDLSPIGKQARLIEWQDIAGQPNPEFVQAVLNTAESDTTIFILCRSGVRSAQACMAVRAAGHQKVINVADGFEGPLDDNHHRGRSAGWKASNLPWQQQ